MLISNAPFSGLCCLLWKVLNIKHFKGSRQVSCRSVMNGFGLFMLFMGLAMGVAAYFMDSGKRLAMTEIRSGRVPSVDVRVAGVSSRMIQTSGAGNQQIWRQSKTVSFVTADGQYFYKGWSRKIERDTGDPHRGYVVDGNLYVPDLYEETQAMHLWFPVIGGCFFALFWLVGKLMCKRLESGSGKSSGKSTGDF